MKRHHIFSVLLPVAGILILILLVFIHFVDQLRDENQEASSPVSTEAEDSGQIQTEEPKFSSGIPSSSKPSSSLPQDHCFICRHGRGHGRRQLPVYCRPRGGI